MQNVETKVIAATAGGASGGVVGSFILWLLGVLVWHTPDDAGHSIQAVAAVPEPVGGFALFLLAGACALGAGYWAPHTSRPDLHPAKSAADSTSSDGEVPAAAPVEAAPAVSTPSEPEAPAAGVPPAAVQDAILGKAATPADGTTPA